METLPAKILKKFIDTYFQDSHILVDLGGSTAAQTKPDVAKCNIPHCSASKMMEFEHKNISVAQMVTGWVDMLVGWLTCW